jgi:hypothetical protein
MTPADLQTARRKLGMSAADLGRALRLGGRDPGLQVRRWERAMTDAVPGPVQVAVEFFLRDLKAAKAATLPADPVTPAQPPPRPAVPTFSRRRSPR